jgi:hypothetical protein
MICAYYNGLLGLVSAVRSYDIAVIAIVDTPYFVDGKPFEILVGQ